LIIFNHTLIFRPPMASAPTVRLDN